MYDKGMVSLRFFVPGLCLLAAIALQARELSNPTKRPYEDALIRLNPEQLLPAGTASVSVMRDGNPVEAQLETVEGGRVVWVAADLEPGAKADYQIRRGRGTGSGKTLIRDAGRMLILSNGMVDLEVPSQWHPGDPLPAPILGFRRSGGETMGVGKWLEHPRPVSFRVEKVGEGPLFPKVRLHYEFEEGEATVDITLPPGRPYAKITSKHDMRRGDGWELVLSRGDSSAKGKLRRWYKGQFDAAPSEETFALKPGYTRLDDTILYLQPRWTQGFDDGWSFGVSGAKGYSGALVVRAGKWRWPHDNKPEAKVMDSGDWAALHLPTFRGQRSWLLLAGEQDLAGEIPLLAKTESFLNPDKLAHSYRLPFEEGEDKLIGGRNFYSNQTNPTGMMRQQNKQRVRDAAAGKTKNSLGALYAAQAFFDPDWYGNMEHHWSPINPNFHTDFIKGGIALAAQLRDHPEFEHVRAMAEAAFRRDMTFAVTLPGGAGQECPGYQQHAMGSWKDLAPICAKYLGFDPREWPRYKEGARFLAKVSVPTGGSRKFHPAGDTHPDRPEPLNWAKGFGAEEDPDSWTTEEFPGFGVVFRSQSGTPNETYLSFKSGPNRGHFHGDQLSLHWVHHGQPLAVDHHASYSPRPGQEHMHNRLSFSVEGIPYANMDGHEGLRAFKTHELADVAVGRVESSRLREVKKLPPEDWDVDEPQETFDTPLKYQRTVVFLKGEPPVVVLVDDFSGPEVTATWNLHVRGDQADRKGDWIDFGNAQVYLPAERGDAFEAFPWEHSNGGREKTTAARIHRSGSEGRFISVLIPGTERPKLSLNGDRLRFDSGKELYLSPDGGIRLKAEDGSTHELLSANEAQTYRSQGDVGLFVPDVGYPFGPLPAWLIEQRVPAP